MTPDRRAAIVRLLDTRHEHLPEPVRRSEISSGFVHGLDPKGKPWRWLSCPDCIANDRVMYGCETCKGSGRIPDPGRDPMAESKIVLYGADGSRHDLAYARDRQIEELGRQTRPAADVDEDADAKAKDYAWAEARRQMFKRYDYAALERAIEWLRSVVPGSSVYGGLALGYFDVVLPNPLRAPAAAPVPVNIAARGRQADTRALSQRDAAIVSAITGGAPTEHVASSFSLSVSQVNKIVRGAAA